MQITQQLRKVDSKRFPLVHLGSKIMKGESPKSYKLYTRQYDTFDPYDYVSDVVLGSTVGASYNTMALLTLDQATRPDVTNMMVYAPQDRLVLPSGQEVEIIMTPTESIRRGVGYTSDDYISGFPVPLTGGTDKTTGTGTVLVRTVTGAAFKPFTSGDTIYTGRAIFEGQDWEAPSRQSDFIYNCQYVEHQEARIEFTEDEWGWLQEGKKIKDNSRQVEDTKEMLMNAIETHALFGEGSFQATYENRAKTNSWGLIPSLKTHVTYYNPDTQDFEALIGNWLIDHCYETNINKVSTKYFLAGGRFMYNFNMAFRELRQLDREGVLKQKIGLDVNAYNIMGYNMVLVPTDVFKMGTIYENWCLCIDPTMGRLCVVNGYNFNTKLLQSAVQRKHIFGVEWKGTYLWEVERSHALLRTV
jgi:hypothetical protein